MPGMTGLEACQRIRDMGYRLPIVAMTANTLEHEKNLCTELGMLFLPKPFTRVDVQQLLTKLKLM